MAENDIYKPWERSRSKSLIGLITPTIHNQLLQSLRGSSFPPALFPQDRTALTALFGPMQKNICSPQWEE